MIIFGGTSNCNPENREHFRSMKQIGETKYRRFGVATSKANRTIKMEIPLSNAHIREAANFGQDFRHVVHSARPENKVSSNDSLTIVWG